MVEYTLKVTPERLVSVSTDVLAKVDRAQNAFEQMSSVISRTYQYWEGNGHDKAVKHYDIRKDDYERVFRALREHVSNLQEIAGVYENTERSNQSIAEILPADVII